MTDKEIVWDKVLCPICQNKMEEIDNTDYSFEIVKVFQCNNEECIIDEIQIKVK